MREGKIHTKRALFVSVKSACSLSPSGTRERDTHTGVGRTFVVVVVVVVVVCLFFFKLSRAVSLSLVERKKERDGRRWFLWRERPHEKERIIIDDDENAFGDRSRGRRVGGGVGVPRAAGGRWWGAKVGVVGERQRGAFSSSFASSSSLFLRARELWHHLARERERGGIGKIQKSHRSLSARDVVSLSLSPLVLRDPRRRLADETPCAFSLPLSISLRFLLATIRNRRPWSANNRKSHTQR